jgi:protease I
MAVRGKKMAMLIENDFEDVEVTDPMKAFKDAGIQIIAAGPFSQMTYQGKQRKAKVKSEILVDKVMMEDYDVLFIPGGYAPDKLRMHQPTLQTVKDFAATGKLIAAICHGPQVLISAGLVKGKRMTSWPAIAIDLQNAGATYVDEPVVRDGQFITSRRPEDIPQFTKAVIEALTAVPAGAR